MKDKPDNKSEGFEWGVPQGPPPDIDLPFGKKRRKEIGERIYDNRETICITVIIYLLAAIVILSSRIILHPRQAEAAIIVEFQDTERIQELEEELQRARQLNDLLNQEYPDYATVRNVVSNENAEEAREDLSGETREIFDRSEQVMQELDRNSYEYGQMLAELAQERPREEEGKRDYRDAKVDGGVTVSFSLARPLRHAVSLPVPSYKCAGGGTVAVDIVVSRNGDVLSASVDKSLSSSDACMTSAALEVAARSRFNVDPSAPGRHSGTVTYVFVPQ